MSENTKSFWSDLVKIFIGAVLGFISAYFLGLIQLNNEKTKIKAEKLEEVYKQSENAIFLLRVDCKKMPITTDNDRKGEELSALVNIYFPELATRVDSLRRSIELFEDMCIDNKLSLEVSLRGSGVMIRDIYGEANQSLINKIANKEVKSFVDIQDRLITDIKKIGKDLLH